MYLSIENSKSKSIYMGSKLGNILLEENSNYLSQTTNETLSKKRKWSSIQRGKRKKSIILMDWNWNLSVLHTPNTSGTYLIFAFLGGERI